MVGEAGCGGGVICIPSPAREQGEGESTITSVQSAGEGAAAADRRPLHDDEAGPFQMLHQSSRNDLRHDLVGVVHALAPLKAERESERVGEFARIGRRELGNGVGHAFEGRLTA